VADAKLLRSFTQLFTGAVLTSACKAHPVYKSLRNPENSGTAAFPERLLALTINEC
jgi:hypothetical protein